MAFFQKVWSKALAAIWIALSLLLLGVFVAAPRLSTDRGAEAPGRDSHFVRLTENSEGTIIFVHGVMGDAVSTWTNDETHAYWPKLLAKDPRFGRYDIFVYEFPSPPLTRSYSIDELADNMRLVLGHADVLHHGKLVFLSHSMGGLVTRAFLLKYRDLIPKVEFLSFFSTPTTGSELAAIARLVSRNPQFENMFPMGDNTYLESLQSAWLAAKPAIRSFCSYEILDTWGVPVVERQSATNLCTEPLNPIQADHVTIVKPADERSIAYLAFSEAFEATRAGQSARAQ